MLEKNYKFLLWIYIFWFLGSVLLTSLHILGPELTSIHSLFLIFAGIFAAVFFIMQYGKGLGLAITILIFVVTLCIEWMQLSYTGNAASESFEMVLNGMPITFAFIWIGLIAGTHIIAREITLKINIDWIRGGIYAIIGATMIMFFEILIDPILLQAKRLFLMNLGFTDIQVSDLVNWWTLGLILHLMIYFILSLTNRWENLKYPDLKSEIITVYWIIIVFFVFLSSFGGLWFSIAITLFANLLFTSGYYLSLAKNRKK
ncbi:carotenoid biosynthesis protein [Listeria sp. PSOL-1]|uniref:carotenoid biosynthesis protein n=1 Tax=Listeria sp. PSOL-1 TaxID=1844999 RepID=UPI0013D808BC|nr:carotenoid biosynthesis protein [Listeria sp. PSOL-1]